MTLDEAKRLSYGEHVHFTGSGPRGMPNNCTRTIGPRGGVKETVADCRVTGNVQTWKRSPERVRVPVRYGLRENGAITEDNLQYWHREVDCPLLQTDGEVPA